MLRIVILSLLWLATGPVAAQDIRVEDAYARTTLRSGAVFLSIVNMGPAADVLLSVSTIAARQSLLHDNQVTEGIASMRPLTNGLPIPADSTTLLERGGNHIMLMGLTGKLPQAATFPLVLVFANAGEITIEVTVDNIRPAE